MGVTRILSRSRLPSWGPRSVGIARRRCCSPPGRCSTVTRTQRAMRSRMRFPACSAAVPVTSRSSRPSSWRRREAGAMADELAVVGKSLTKPDAFAKVSGQTRFADDLALPRMLFGRILRSPHPHARIVRVDTSRARAVPGGLAVLTGDDLPIKFGILPVSQDEEALAREKVRYVGDPIAAVAATDEWIADEALELIDVQFEELPAVMSIEDAVVSHGEPIHGKSKVHKAVALEFGDTEAAMRAAAHVREDTVFFEGNTHLPMEQHAALAQVAADGKLTLWTSSQTPHYVHRALGKVLEMPMSRIRVIATPNGGVFGGNSDIFAHELVA